MKDKFFLLSFNKDIDNPNNRRIKGKTNASRLIFLKKRNEKRAEKHPIINPVIVNDKITFLFITLFRLSYLAVAKTFLFHFGHRILFAFSSFKDI